MKNVVSWGVARSLEGREAARRAAQKALDQDGSARPAAALVFFSQDFNPEDCLTGVANLLGDTPIWGFSTVAPLDKDGEHLRSVMIITLSGRDIRTQMDLLQPDVLQSSGLEALKPIAQSIQSSSAVLIAGNGFDGRSQEYISALTGYQHPIAGALASAEQQRGITSQIAGKQFATGGLATLALSGNLMLGVGMAHGWQDVGISFQVSKMQGSQVQFLDDLVPAEIYTQFFGKSLQEWQRPPLEDLIRLYPLGIEIFPGSTEFILRSPLRMEADGSLLMNAPGQRRTNRPLDDRQP